MTTDKNVKSTASRLLQLICGALRKQQCSHAGIALVRTIPVLISARHYGQLDALNCTHGIMALARFESVSAIETI